MRDRRGRERCPVALSRTATWAGVVSEIGPHVDVSEWHVGDAFGARAFGDFDDDGCGGRRVVEDADDGAAEVGGGHDVAPIFLRSSRGVMYPLSP